MGFAETMATNPPRMVVLFQRGHDGSEQFQWGVVGSIPILTLIGAIAQAQADLLGGDWMPECDKPALVITWVATDRTTYRFIHPDIPAEPLVGMLETIKSMLVASRMAQHAGANRILGPDGKPAPV
jgi:hypothetical protein